MLEGPGRGVSPRGLGRERVRAAGRGAMVHRLCSIVDEASIGLGEMRAVCVRIQAFTIILLAHENVQFAFV